jgi:hypothetical protein
VFVWSRFGGERSLFVTLRYLYWIGLFTAGPFFAVALLIAAVVDVITGSIFARTALQVRGIMRLSSSRLNERLTYGLGLDRFIDSRACLLQEARGRAVLVSGCDSGFGREVSLVLLQRGWCVYAGCYTAEGAQVTNDLVLYTYILHARITDIDCALQREAELLG